MRDPSSDLGAALLSSIPDELLPGIDKILVRATRIASIVVCVVTPILAVTRALRLGSDPAREVILAGSVDLLLLGCIGLCATRWGRRHAELNLLGGASVVVAGMILSVWTGGVPILFFSYLAFIAPLGLAAFAPVRPRTILALSVVVYVTHALSVWWIPQAHAVDVFMACAISLAIGVLGAVAVQSQRLVLLDLHRARNAAQRSDQLKTQFLANVSHEIRTPMTGVLGFAEELEESLGSDVSEYQAELFAAVGRNGRHLLLLIDEILDLSKLETGQLDLQSEVCCPCELVRDAARTLERQAVGKGLGFEVDLSEDLPAAIRTDPRRIHQILLNLLMNAVKFTERGSIRIAAHVESPASQGVRRLAVEVLDTGPGIPSSDLERVFDPFFQTSTPSRPALAGVGLGLAVSRELARALGGDLTVTSVLGEGCRFRLELPMDIAASPERSAIQAASSPVEALEGRVLLAEDGRDNQRLITRALEGFGLEVDLVEDGAAACAHALAAAEAGDPYDVILMDMSMPILDGYGATHQLREAGYTGPIIALTAHAMSGDRERCLAAGCDGYLSKPFQRHQLAATLVEVLEKRDPGAPPRRA